MRTFSFGRAFPAACLTAIALLSAVAPSNAQSLPPDAPVVAANTPEGARVNATDGFVLVEHSHHSRAAITSMPDGISPAKRDGGPSFELPIKTPKIVRSSPARDRVIRHIWAAEVRHGLPSGLLDALVAAESGYRPYAVSKAGAAGLAQLMPATARSLGVLNRFDIYANLDGGARYLRSMIDKFKSVSMALAAYNAGPGAVLRAGGIPRNGETPLYVMRVLRLWRSDWRKG